MLQTYKKKRDFSKTSEPSGSEKGTRASSKGKTGSRTGTKSTAPSKKDLPSFVIQKHAASHLHYDFRLECGGVLLSWAVPKGPSLDPSVKRLAVQVEDHPLAYGGFEGLIPAGQYGGGEVIVWDNGYFCTDTALGDPTVHNAPTRPPAKLLLSRSAQEKEILAGLKKGKLAFTLFGKKLHGSFTLVRTARSPKDWLLIKHKDKFVDTENDITEKENSVLSRKTIDSLKKINPDLKKLDLKKSDPGKKPASERVKKKTRNGKLKKAG